MNIDKIKLATGGILPESLKTEVIAKVDVLIVGGGSAGVTAAIAASEEGAKTLLLESSGRLGGMMTSGNAGLTNSIFHHKKQSEQHKIVEKLEDTPKQVQIVGGLPKKIMHELMDKKYAVGTHGTAGSYVFTSPVEFNWLLMDMMEEAGVQMIFHAFAVDTVMKNDSISGIIIESKEGRQAILADMVIDASGDGDVAARAGADFTIGVGSEDKAYIDNPKHAGKMDDLGVMYRLGNINIKKALDYMDDHREHFLIQILAKYSFAEVKKRFIQNEMICFSVKGKEIELQVYNSPQSGVVTLCCPSMKGNGLKLSDLSNAEIEMKNVIRKQLDDVRMIPGFDQCILIDVPEIGVRETRHITGEYLLTVDDIQNSTQFEDSIGRGSHTIDTNHISESIKDKDIGDNWSFQIPYRCLVPKKIENLLVAGKCASFSHEAFGAARTTVQCMIMGEAAGVAAAMCIKNRKTPRTLSNKSLTTELVRRKVVI